MKLQGLPEMPMVDMFASGEGPKALKHFGTGTSEEFAKYVKGVHVAWKIEVDATDNKSTVSLRDEAAKEIAKVQVSAREKTMKRVHDVAITAIRERASKRAGKVSDTVGAAA